MLPASVAPAANEDSEQARERREIEEDHRICAGEADGKRGGVTVDDPLVAGGNFALGCGELLWRSGVHSWS